MNVEVRPREPRDLDVLGHVLVRVHDQDGYPVEGVADPVAWLAPPREIAAWTALVDGEPVGQASLTKAGPDDDAAKIWQQHTRQNINNLAIPVRLFVDPAHRQHGAASLLLRTIREYAVKHGLVLAFDVMLKDQSAIRLYEALGCIRIGTFDHVHSDGQHEPAAVYVAPT